MNGDEWEIRYTHKSLRDLDKLSKISRYYHRLIIDEINISIKEDPYESEELEYQLYKYRKVRIDSYRIIMRVDDISKIVRIVRIAERGGGEGYKTIYGEPLF